MKYYVYNAKKYIDSINNARYHIVINISVIKLIKILTYQEDYNEQCKNDP